MNDNDIEENGIEILFYQSVQVIDSNSYRYKNVCVYVYVFRSVLRKWKKQLP